MKMRGSSSNTANTLKRALEAAEAAYGKTERPKEAPPYVQLKLEQVEMRPELFQPREFSFGAKTTDTQYVKKLAGQIKLVGELDPILVIRLENTWVCIDGHHRVQAYKHAKWEGAIKCEWFGGTVREAADEAIRRNRTVKLEVPKEDRQEQAWKRVLLGWGSKREIQRLCGVSEGMVAMMRRVKRAASDRTNLAIAFQERLGGPLMEMSWSLARLAYLDAEPAELDIEQRAGRLARSIRARLTNTLSQDPSVTARALAIYDPELPEPLAEALQKNRPNGDDQNGTTPELAKVTAELERRRLTPTTTLTQRRTALVEELKQVDEELARRDDVSESDLKWTAWVLEEKAKEAARDSDNGAEA
jgi:ParB-like nuclease domain